MQLRAARHAAAFFLCFETGRKPNQSLINCARLDRKSYSCHHAAQVTIAAPLSYHFDGSLMHSRNAYRRVCVFVAFPSTTVDIADTRYVHEEGLPGGDDEVARLNGKACECNYRARVRKHCDDATSAPKYIHALPVCANRNSQLTASDAEEGLQGLMVVLCITLNSNAKHKMKKYHAAVAQRDTTRCRRTSKYLQPSPPAYFQIVCHAD